MHPLFFAWGPLVKGGKVLDPFNTTELYSLWAYVLELEVEHEVSSAASLNMLFQRNMTSDHPVASSDKTLSGVTRNSSIQSPVLNGENQIQGGAPRWMLWSEFSCDADAVSQS